MDVRTAYEEHADPRAKYVSHALYSDGLSIVYQVDGYHSTSMAYQPLGGGNETDAAAEIGKSVLSDMGAA